MKKKQPKWDDFVPGSPAFDPLGGKIYINSRYQVAVRGMFEHPVWGRWYQASLKRRDKEPIMDWRDMQLIKNTFFGDDATMLQIFPPEKHLVDTSNQYYFFALLDYEMPFGFKERLISDATNSEIPTGGRNKQRPFDERHQPATFEADKAHAAKVIADFSAQGAVLKR